MVGYAGKIDWAAKAAFTHVTDESLDLSPNSANARIAQLLRAEHRRAVRVVTAEIKRVKLDRHNYSVVTRAEMTKCLDRLLTALQRGRGSDGRSTNKRGP